MNSILIQTQFPHRVSLSQASQLTGYHQDYLGLLCRLGKMRASKIGRNWYTTKADIQEFLKSPGKPADKIVLSPEEVARPEITVVSRISLDEDMVQNAMEEKQEVAPEEVSEQEQPIELGNIKVRVVASPKPRSLDGAMPKTDRAQEPRLVENVVISSLDSLPIKLVKKPEERHHHNLQTLIMRAKLDSLRDEVLVLSGFMDNVNTELAHHREVLNRHERMLASRKDLQDSFAAGIEMSSVRKPIHGELGTFDISRDEKISPRPASVKITWLWPALAILLVTLASGMLLITQKPESLADTGTTYYSATQIEEPQVAGESIIVDHQ